MALLLAIEKLPALGNRTAAPSRQSLKSISMLHRDEKNQWIHVESLKSNYLVNQMEYTL